MVRTAHPYKFKSTVEPEIGTVLEPVLEFEDQQKQSIEFENDFDSFKEYLLSG